MWAYSKKAVVYKPGREASEETELADTLILDFQSPEMWEDKILLFKWHSLGYFNLMSFIFNEVGTKENTVLP